MPTSSTPETNGDSPTRLDRIEALLDKVAHRQEQLVTTQYLHDERMTHVETMHEENEERWQAWREEEAEYRRGQRERDRALDGRVDKLVSAIGELVGRLPLPR